MLAALGRARSLVLADKIRCIVIVAAPRDPGDPLRHWVRGLGSIWESVGWLEQVKAWLLAETKQE